MGALSCITPLPDGVARLLNTATGMEFSKNELKKAADRVYLLQMAFNARQGISRKDGRLPLKFDKIGTSEGNEELTKNEEMLNKYYGLRGCNKKNGILNRKKLESLGLGFVVDDMEALDPNRVWNGPPLWTL